MRLLDVPATEIHDRLAGDGLTIRTGPFTCTIRTALGEVGDYVAQVYAGHPVLDRPVFSDFHVGLHATRSFWRPWLRRATVSAGGVPLFSSFPIDETPAYLEWGMNGCIARSAHHLLLFHAASLEHEGRAVLFAGQTGTGKSTLAAALVLRGWRLLSDEFGLVTLDSGRCLPLARPICLKNDAIEVIRQWEPRAELTPPADVRRKGRLCHLPPPRGSVERMDELADPSAICFLRFMTGEPGRLEELSKPEAMRRAIECSFNYRALGRAGFDMLGQMVNQCRCYTLTYGSLCEVGRLVEGVG